MIKLNLCSGTHHWKEFVNIDVDPKYKPDILLDLAKEKLPFKNDSVNGILMNHCLEHFFKLEAEAILKECYRVLKPNGVLALELPELVKVCRLFLDVYNGNKPYVRGEGLTGFYGDTSLNPNIHGAHKWGWTEKSLRETLERTGFKIRTVSDGKLHHHPKRDIFIQAEKQVEKKINKKIVFLPMGSINIYSARVRCYQIAEQLNKLGWNCAIGKEYLDDQGFIVFQKRYDAEYLKIAKEYSGKIIFDMCDPYWNIEKERKPIEDFIKEVDCVVTSSNKLALWFEQRGKKTKVIPDGFDFSLIPKVKKEKKLTIVWHGSRANIFCLKTLVKPLNKLSKEFDFNFRIIVNKKPGKSSFDPIPQFEFEPEIVEWKLDTHLSEIAKCHIGIAPLEKSEWCSYKSVNKPITYMALGLPVVCSSIPSYEEIIVSDKNGFIVRNNASEEWYQALKYLINHEETRLSFVKEGRKIAQIFSLENMAKKWDDLLWSMTINKEGGEENG